MGMMLASLFLMWGREAFHLTQLFTEPVYFVSGLNFPVARLGFLGALALGTIPLAVGLDAMRQLAFVGAEFPVGTPPPEVEALILVAMTFVFLGRRSLDAPKARAHGPPGGPLVGALAMTVVSVPSDGSDAVAAGLAVARRGVASTRDAPVARTPATTGRPSARPSDWAGRWRRNWTDPLLFFIYSVAKPLSAALILVVMLDIISGGADPAYRAFVVVGTALWAIVLAGIAGPAWSILDDRERYRMLKYVYVSPSDFVVTLLGRGVARLAVGTMGGLITIAVGVLWLGVPFDPAVVDWPLLVVVADPWLRRDRRHRLLLAAICLQTRQESWSYPEALAGALFLVSGVVFPLSVLPTAAPGRRLASRRSPGGSKACVTRSSRPARRPSAAPEACGRTVTGTAAPDPATIVIALLATGTLVTLAATGVFRVSERRAKDRGLLDQTTGS